MITLELNSDTITPGLDELSRQIADALAEAKSAAALLDAAKAATDRSVAALEAALEATVQRGVQALVEDLPPPSEHRRQHRPGRIPILVRDAELRAFVEARLDRCTFHQIADAVAAHFPPDRRIGHSAIHAWHQRSQARRR